MKKVLQLIIPIFILFLGFNVNAQTGYKIQGLTSNIVEYSNDGTLIDAQGNWMNNPGAWRFYIGNWESLTQGNKYIVEVNYEIEEQETSTITQCGLNINGAYVGTNYINYSRVSSNYIPETAYKKTKMNINISYTANENLGNVPIFVQCDAVPIGGHWRNISYVSYVTINPNQENGGNWGEIVNGMNNNTNNIMNNNNYNTDREIQNENRNHQEVMEELRGQHALASEFIESTRICKFTPNTSLMFKSNELAYPGIRLTTTGLNEVNENYVTTDFIPFEFLSKQDKLSIEWNSQISTGVTPKYRYCFYNSNKVKIGACQQQSAWYNEDITLKHDTLNPQVAYIRFSFNYNPSVVTTLTLNGNLLKCENAAKAQYEEQEKQTGFLGQIKDTINNTYNTIVGTITNVIQGIGTTISNMFNWFTSTDIDTSRLNTLINRLKENSPPIFSILTSLKNYVQSFNPNNTCQPISIPMNTNIANHNITIPCGTTLFWNREDVSTFKTWWNLFVGGLLIYVVGLKLIKVIDGAFDPQKDEVGKGLEV